MVWPYIVVPAVLILGVAAFGRSREACPKCGHAKGTHVPHQIDGVPLGPFECSVCQRQCTW
jgi:hypothetical protein